MQKTAWFFAAALLVALSAAGQGGPQPAPRPAPIMQRFVSREFNFSVMMPGQPNVSREVITGKNGRPIRLTTYARDLGSRAYLVQVSEYDNQTKISLEGAVDGIISGRTQAHVLSRRETTFFGYPGRIVDLTVENGLRTRYHVFVAGKRLYQVAMIARPDEFQSAEPDFFLNSFYLRQ
jgi:hypothetical protein